MYYSYDYIKEYNEKFAQEHSKEIKRLSKDEQKALNFVMYGADDRFDRDSKYYVEIKNQPPKMSVSGFMGYLKGKSSLMIFQRFGNLKFAYRNREFWCRGYYVDTAGKNTAAIKAYIQNQLKIDRETDQISIFDPRDPFTGSK